MANPLKLYAKPLSEDREHLTAAEFAAIARENGDLKKAKLWDAEARLRGEEPIPYGLTVRYNENGTKRRAPIAS
jgi:hypothetical protein